MDDLDQLSHEIAATSPDWLIPGMEAIADGRVARAIGPERDGFWLFCDAVVFRVEVRLCRPNLRDDLTVNALLGADGEAWFAGRWHLKVGDYEAHDKNRMFGICRAWIAAKGKG